MLKGVEKGTDEKDKPFIFLKRQSIRKKKRLLSNQPEVMKKKDEYCINVCACVCFTEEVILADDENENDYDGIYAHKRAFLLCILTFALAAAAAAAAAGWLA